MYTKIEEKKTKSFFFSCFLSGSTSLHPSLLSANDKNMSKKESDTQYINMAFKK